MLNLEKCKKILQQNGKHYTDEEVKQIRNLLYKIGNLDYQIFKNTNQLQHAKRNTVHKGINR
jgi:uncharacterized protein YpuA (DUF1002 family)